MQIAHFEKQWQLFLKIRKNRKTATVLSTIPLINKIELHQLRDVEPNLMIQANTFTSFGLQLPFPKKLLLIEWKWYRFSCKLIIMRLIDSFFPHTPPSIVLLHHWDNRLSGNESMKQKPQCVCVLNFLSDLQT